MKSNYPLKEEFRKYHELNEEIKLKESLYDNKIEENKELESEYDVLQKQVSEKESALNSKKDELFTYKNKYINHRGNKHSFKVFVISFLIPFILNFRLMSISYLFGLSSALGILFSVVEDALFGKANKKRFISDYVKTSEYIKLNNEYKKLHLEFAEKLNEFNDMVLKIHTKQNEIEQLKGEINKLKSDLNKMITNIVQKMEVLYFGDEKYLELFNEKPMELKRK